MKRFQFALENVLKHRKTQENLAQRDFQILLAELATENQTLEEMLGAIVEASSKRHEIEIQGGQASGHLSQVHEYLTGQKVRVERQRQKIVEVEKRVEEARVVLRERALETKIIQELRTRRLKEHKALLRKRETLQLDDLVVMRHRLKEGSKD